MAKISNTTAYPLKPIPNGRDMVIITDGEDGMETKNAYVEDILAVQTGIVTFSEATVTLSAGEVAALVSAPVTLVPAQGNDSYIFPIAAAAKLEYGTTTYDFNIAESFKITTASFAPNFYGEIPCAFVNSTSTAVTGGPLGSATLIATGIASPNQPLILYGTGNTAATTGDGILTVTVQYTQVII
tara:strand:+ start:2290 stop:2844 length:555 start_codon:yes stop_codon:yes gene_type:complete